MKSQSSEDGLGIQACSKQRFLADSSAQPVLVREMTDEVLAGT